MTDRDGLLALAARHAALEGEPEGDLDAVLATMHDDPVYELFPVGRVFRGADAARRYYEHFFGTFRPLVADYVLRNEYVGDTGLAQEYTIWTSTGRDGARERHDVAAVLTFGTDRLSGERVFASDRLLQLMFGPAYDLAETAAAEG